MTWPACGGATCFRRSEMQSTRCTLLKRPHLKGTTSAPFLAATGGHTSPASRYRWPKALCYLMAAPSRGWTSRHRSHIPFGHGDFAAAEKAGVLPLLAEIEDAELNTSTARLLDAGQTVQDGSRARLESPVPDPAIRGAAHDGSRGSGGGHKAGTRGRVVPECRLRTAAANGRSHRR